MTRVPPPPPGAAPGERLEPAAQDDAAEDLAPGLEPILAMVRDRLGVRLDAWRPGMVARRVGARVARVGARGLEDYRLRLESDPDEVERLIAHVAIKVSRFHRDAEVFETLRERVLPDLARRRGTPLLAAWSVGCARGEEAYSLAGLLDDLARNDAGPPFLVWGTDIDAAALAAARLAVYAPAAVAEMPPRWRDATLVPERQGGRAAYRVRADLAERVRFQRHDLLDAPPPPVRFDLVCCRNVLIYMTHPRAAEAQAILRDALAVGGYLCLGDSEWLHEGMMSSFEVFDSRARIFRKTAHA